jgi:hypothetical protein
MTIDEPPLNHVVNIGPVNDFLQNYITRTIDDLTEIASSYLVDLSDVEYIAYDDEGIPEIYRSPFDSRNVPYLAGFPTTSDRGVMKFIDEVGKVYFYRGFFSNGKAEGAGALFNENYDLKTYGTFKEGTLVRGAHFSEKTSFIGNFDKMGNREGEGIFLKKSSLCYCIWKNNKRNGNGIHLYSSGNLYEGMYKDNRKNGLGKYRWKDKTIYNGTFKNGEIRGFGTCFFTNGSVYEGSFWRTPTDGFCLGEEVEEENRRALNGKSNVNKRKFKLDDRINGWGKYTDTDGCIYLGELRNGVLFGDVACKPPEGSPYLLRFNKEEVIFLKNYPDFFAAAHYCHTEYLLRRGLGFLL